MSILSSIYSRIFASVDTPSPKEPSPTPVESIEVSDGEDTFTLRCRTEIERYRARTYFEKEKGTIAWIRESVKSGDVFFDIGANVGIYTLLAANKVGAKGQVYAFEPHVLNFASLLENLATNNLEKRVFSLCLALTDREGIFPFNYINLEPGSSMSQLDRLIDGWNKEFHPVATELKLGFSLDYLIEKGFVPSPDHIKMDVDGIEPKIIEGMKTLLSSSKSPKTVQVELGPDTQEGIESQMARFNYSIKNRHYTQHGLEQISKGAPKSSVVHNVVFAK